MGSPQASLQFEDLPPAACKYGYPHEQLQEILGERLPVFYEWMNGQTMALCEGTKCATAHGIAVYGHDLHRFLDGLPVID